MTVRNESGISKIHISEISSIVLATTQVYLSCHLLMELAKAKVPVIISDEKSNPVGEFLPLYGAHNPSKRIHEQMGWSEPAKKRVWQKVVKHKIGHQADVLLLFDRVEEAAQLRAGVGEVKSGDVTNREAWAAKIYFSALFGSDFTRTSDCVVNSSLNYGYAVLLSMVNREIVARGYLTQVGIFHKNEYNPFNLSCDLMEPFRPLVDKIVMETSCECFDREEKLRLASVGTQRVSFEGGSYKASSVVSGYVQSCLNALAKRKEVGDIEDYSF